jgi:hypothetical protein
MARIRQESGARRLARWGWALAAAAMFVIAFGIWWMEQPRTFPQIAHAPELAAIPATPKPAEAAIDSQTAPKNRVRPKPPEITKVKMFTDDPDVVIYWLIEKKEGTE